MRPLSRISVEARLERHCDAHLVAFDRWIYENADKKRSARFVSFEFEKPLPLKMRKPRPPPWSHLKVVAAFLDILVSVAF
jgi:hypothetical protein